MVHVQKDYKHRRRSKGDREMHTVDDAINMFSVKAWGVQCVLYAGREECNVLPTRVKCERPNEVLFVQLNFLYSPLVKCGL